MIVHFNAEGTCSGSLVFRIIDHFNQYTVRFILYDAERLRKSLYSLDRADKKDHLWPAIVSQAEGEQNF
ncbi:MAG: hypothetical protein ACJAVI_005179 [Candidatus Azotimanducaceae bacterium]|jgi:hypothetical protein